MRHVLILASASPARLATLRSAGIEPTVIVSDVDENAVLASATERTPHGALTPVDAVLTLARAKAEAVAGLTSEGLVLGCDSMLAFDGRILGKPADAAEATERWRAMRGRTGVLHTGHWLIDTAPTHTAPTHTAPTEDAAGVAAVGRTASTVVHFADLTDAEIDAYVAADEPLHVAGAFTIDGLGGPFVERIEGDHHTVVGLSLPLLRHLLGELGVTIPQLWNRGTAPSPL